MSAVVRKKAAKQAVSLCLPDSEADCICASAVRRVFDSLHAAGLPPPHAIDAAITVYQWHHPEAGGLTARETVEYWLRGPAH